MKPRPGTAGGCSPSAPHESIYRLTDRGREWKGYNKGRGHRRRGKAEEWWIEEKDEKWFDGGHQDGEQKIKSEGNRNETAMRMQISDQFYACFSVTCTALWVLQSYPADSLRWHSPLSSWRVPLWCPAVRERSNLLPAWSQGISGPALCSLTKPNATNAHKNKLKKPSVSVSTVAFWLRTAHLCTWSRSVSSSWRT